MTVVKALVDFLNSKDGKSYVYISKTVLNLEAVKQAAVEQCDMTPPLLTKIILVQPIGVGGIKGEVDGVYYDTDCTSLEHLNKFLVVKSEGFIKLVDNATQEILEQ